MFVSSFLALHFADCTIQTFPQFLSVKRNIADDLDSTRWEELSIIEGPGEISPLKNQNVLLALPSNTKRKPPIRKEPSMIAEEDELPKPKSTPKATPKRKNIKNKSFLATSDDEESETPKPPQRPPPSSTKTSVRSKRVQIVRDSPADTSQSMLRRDKEKVTPIVRKRNPPRTPAEIARDRLRKICDSDSESGNDSDKDVFMTSDEDEDWDAKKDASSSTSSSSSDDEFVPRTARKRGQLAGASSTAKKKPATKAQKLVYLDLSSEEVVEVDENYQPNVSEEDLAEVTRKFLESDLNDSTDEK